MEGSFIALRASIPSLTTEYMSQIVSDSAQDGKGLGVIHSVSQTRLLGGVSVLDDCVGFCVIDYQDQMEPVNKQDFCDLKGALDSCKENLSLEHAESLILKDDLEKCKEAKVEGEKNFMVQFTKLTLELRQSTTDLRREISALKQDNSATSMLAASNLKEISALKQDNSALKQDNSTLKQDNSCLLYTSPSPRDRTRSRMPSSA